MFLEVYIDVIFLINFIMDIILLLTVQRILRCNSSIVRMLSGAAVGAVGACILAIFPNLNGLVQFLLSYIIICTAMIYIAYNLKGWRARVKAIILLYITTFFLGGVVNSLYYNTKLGFYFKELIQGRLYMNLNTTFYVLAILIILILLPIFIKTIHHYRSGISELYKVELTYKDKYVRVTGFLDTGNSLYDPIYGKPVLIAECSALEPLFTVHQINFLNALLDTVEGKASLTNNKNHTRDKCTSQDYDISQENDLYDEDEERLNFMMIPYHSIGKSGMLPAIIMNKVVIWDGEEQICNDKVLTAVSRNRISKESEYQVILHRGIM